MNLKWKNQFEQANLKMLELGDFSDVTFVVGPSKDRIQAHKLILASRSAEFSALFDGTWEESSDPGTDRGKFSRHLTSGGLRSHF